ncbi:response regulator transcription factor [Pelagibaculum spongiae]|uniref:DNA-binding response regulator n=1 Tax=Pelagibaculum spongiae TaxID=2080658 RepID=A0A2V1H2A7_9GAMM|nr:response regulator transcription factor [Pelagibaculum spongiae]PVZ72100.1 DNA-binding response regulator [Pelagibaculum spongiae]
MNTENTKPYILLVEDDLELAKLTANYLDKNGFHVETVSNGSDAVEVILRTQPALLILDLMLPGKDGMDICKEVRNQFSAPILMLTAKSDDIDQILGLEIGADDYLCKPAEPRLLLARVKALLRRNDRSQQDSNNQQLFRFGNLSIDKRRRSVKVDQNDVDLNTQEFELLCCLADNAGHVLSRDDIFQQVRGFEYDGVSRFVDITISHLRNKLNDNGSKPQRIKTVFGKGYMLNDL